LRNSALVLFEVTANYLFSKKTASGTDFQNTGFLPASAKLAVKYRPGRWNTGHLATHLPNVSALLGTFKFVDSKVVEPELKLQAPAPGV